MVTRVSELMNQRIDIVIMVNEKGRHTAAPLI